MRELRTEAAVSDQRSRQREPNQDRRAALLLGAHAVLWVGMLIGSCCVTEDVSRFVQLANSPGTPYRDFQVEYAPLQTLLVRMLFGTDLQHAIGRIVLLSALSDVALFLVIRRHWGDRAGVAYLALTLPMQVFLPFRFDLVPVLLAVLAIALIRRGKHLGGGCLLGIAILTKVWPVALVPGLLGRRDITGAIACMVTTAIGVVGWVLVAGWDGPTQVATFRGASGWQIESTVGALVWIAGSDYRYELGAIRTGSTQPWQTALLGVLTVAVVAACWLRARRRSVDPAGMPAMAAVAAMTALSPVASAQYVSWIIPWAAIATTERRRPAVAILAAGASVLAAAVFLVYWHVIDSIGLLQGIALGRAACVIGLVVLWFIDRPAEDGGEAA